MLDATHTFAVEQILSVDGDFCHFVVTALPDDARCITALRRFVAAKGERREKLAEQLWRELAQLTIREAQKCHAV